VAVAFIDLDHMIVPEKTVLGMTVLGVCTASFRGFSLLDAAVGALVGFVMVWLPFDVLYRKIRGRTGMALGDAMLVMVAGAWFGAQGAVFALLAGSVQGAVAAGAILFLKGEIEEPEAVKKEREEILAELETLPPEERAEVEKELAKDPIFEKVEGTMGARIPFGPFLALAILEDLFVGSDVLELLR
jgi:leader peptidase (prepilin peptidase) / N-methyltransferase